MIALSLLFGIAVLINGSSLAGMQGRCAQQFDLPGSGIIPYVPWLALGCYAAAIFLLTKVKAARKRWVGFAAVTIAANIVISYPIIVLERGSVRIPIDDSLSKEGYEKFEKYHSIRWVSYSSSPQGACVRVGRNDYSDTLRHFVKRLETK